MSRTASRVLTRIIQTWAAAILPSALCYAIDLTAFDGRWLNEAGSGRLTWIDLRFTDASHPAILAWWSCGRQDGCLQNAPLNISRDGEIKVRFADESGRESILRIRAIDGGLSVVEEFGYIDGRAPASVQKHRFRRFSQPPQTAGSQPDLQFDSNGQMRVFTPAGSRQVPPPPRSKQPRLRSSGREAEPGTERQSASITVQAFAPPYNPDDPEQLWIQKYNDFLLQVLSYLLRPDQVQQYLQTESPVPFDRFGRRSILIDAITVSGR